MSVTDRPPDHGTPQSVVERRIDGLREHVVEHFPGGSSELVASLTPLQRRILARQRRHGTRGSVIVMTIITVMVSVVATAIVSGVIVGDRGWALWADLILAVVLPVTLTLLISKVMMGLHAQIIRAHDTLDVAASTDALTGISNRRHFFAHAHEVFARVPPGARLVVCMLDVDQFKVINDEYGHAAGDEALRTLAVRLRAAVPLAGAVGRMGGDEMAVVMPLLEMNADEVVEGIRRACTDVAVAPGLTIDASVGWSIVERGQGLDVGLERADRHLYTVKGQRTEGPTHVRPPE